MGTTLPSYPRSSSSRSLKPLCPLCLVFKLFLKSLFFTIILAGLILLVLFFFPSKTEEPAAKDQTEAPLWQHPKNRHDADIPPELTQVSWDPRFILLSSLQRAKTPTATSFIHPLGSTEGAFSYSAQGFKEANAARGGAHLGEDYNGIGGENTDKGDPVHAVADGLVVYTGTPSPSWGKVVILAHKLPDGQIIQSFYAHLLSSQVRYGQLIAQGKVLGQVGDAGGTYLAHLHFELMGGSSVQAGDAGYGDTIENRLAPKKMLSEGPRHLTQKPFREILPQLEKFELEAQRNTLKYTLSPP